MQRSRISGRCCALRRRFDHLSDWAKTPHGDTHLHTMKKVGAADEQTTLDASQTEIGHRTGIASGVERLGAELYYSKLDELFKHSAESSAFASHGRLLSRNALPSMTRFCYTAKERGKN
jgi:hypothetical protein